MRFAPEGLLILCGAGFTDGDGRSGGRVFAESMGRIIGRVRAFGGGFPTRPDSSRSGRCARLELPISLAAMCSRSIYGWTVTARAHTMNAPASMPVAVEFMSWLKYRLEKEICRREYEAWAARENLKRRRREMMTRVASQAVAVLIAGLSGFLLTAAAWL